MHRISCNRQHHSAYRLNRVDYKQAGTGPSRRHIQGSKIAKGLQSAKVLVNWGHFDEKKSHNVGKKTERADPLGFFNIHSYAKSKKNEEEKSHNAEKLERETI